MESRKRRRISRACEGCRSRKVRCNGEDPCETCWQSCISCVYRDYTRKRNKAPEPKDRTPTDCTPESSAMPNKEQQKPKAARYSPQEYRRQLEIRAGIGVSNSQTGSFQFYGDFDATFAHCNGKLVAEAKADQNLQVLLLTSALFNASITA